MNENKRVRELAVECVGKIKDAALKVDWENKDVYATWLSQTYFYVCYATRVLSFAASRCTLEQEAFHMKLLQGVTEEQGHEILAVRDLKAIGRDISQFKELPATTAYYQTLFYNISVDGPMSLIGYFIPLEGLAAIGLSKTLGRLIELHGDKGTEFLRMHCVVDEGHFEEGLAFLEGLDANALKTVEKHLKLSTALYIQILNEVMSSTASRSMKKAA